MLELLAKVGYRFTLSHRLETGAKQRALVGNSFEGYSTQDIFKTSICFFLIIFYFFLSFLEGMLTLEMHLYCMAR